MADSSAGETDYISDRFYRELIESFTDWQTDNAMLDDSTVRDAGRRLVEREARLLEERRYDEWIGMFAAQCVYWVPASPHGGDSRREVAVAFDDRRRLEDRIYRLESGFAWSQQPPSRTSRLVANVTVFATGREDVLMVRSNFITTEIQGGDIRTRAGWYGHRLGRRGDEWEILVKQVNLLECDQNLRKPQHRALAARLRPQTAPTTSVDAYPQNPSEIGRHSFFCITRYMREASILARRRASMAANAFSKSPLKFFLMPATPSCSKP